MVHDNVEDQYANTDVKSRRSHLECRLVYTLFSFILAYQRDHSCKQNDGYSEYYYA